MKLSEVQRLALDIANEPRLDPSAGAAEKLPPRFFELQDVLKKTRPTSSPTPRRPAR